MRNDNGDDLRGALVLTGVVGFAGVLAFGRYVDPGVSDWLIPVALLILIPVGVWFFGYLREIQERHRDLEYVHSGMAAIDSMPRYRVRELRRRAIPPGRMDGLHNRNRRIWRLWRGPCRIERRSLRGGSMQETRQIRRCSAVQQVVAGAAHHRCTSSMVVANQEFTKAANQLANTHSCRLVGRK